VTLSDTPATGIFSHCHPALVSPCARWTRNYLIKEWRQKGALISAYATPRRIKNFTPRHIHTLSIEAISFAASKA